MPLEDLDLEFEDEEEQKKKKNEAVHVDVDLEFGVAEKPAPAPQPAAPVAPVAAADSSAPKAAPTQKTDPNVKAPAAAGQVKNLDEMRAKIAQAKKPAATAAPAAAQAPATTAPMISGANALQMAPEVEGLNLAQLSQMIEDTKFEAEVKVAVAQEKAVFMAEILSDAKLLQHQIQQLLVRVNAKHPQAKPELMAIQKALADFLAKQRK